MSFSSDNPSHLFADFATFSEIEKFTKSESLEKFTNLSCRENSSRDKVGSKMESEKFERLFEPEKFYTCTPILYFKMPSVNTCKKTKSVLI